MIDLKILGCHGGETRKHRSSSFLVNDRLALDCGAVTSMLSLREQRKIERVLVSHAHFDHVRDVAILAEQRCQQGGPTLEVCGLRSTLQELSRHFFNDRLWPDFTKIPAGDGPTIRYRPLHLGRKTELGGLKVTPIRVDHTIDTAGFLLDDGKSSLLYSGDTGPTEKLWQVANRQENLAGVILECSFPDEEEELARISAHLTPKLVARELDKLSAEKAEVPVLIFHVKPVFEKKAHRDLARIKNRDIHVLELGDHYKF